ncbi:hypothetical protein SKAU_G00384370 [Synaphobranchus kaupii]|uniref:Uncharacterized protein n=1 Tax=Synaphobranchus kaupii TaxID=118154 RepID=A0A9Q1IEZ3_SYNKA|nr:hypothetical protein SKAU_G00384370 [Synaphobranchus kaupii]
MGSVLVVGWTNCSPYGPKMVLHIIMQIACGGHAGQWNSAVQDKVQIPDLHPTFSSDNLTAVTAMEARTTLRRAQSLKTLSTGHSEWWEGTGTGNRTVRRDRRKSVSQLVEQYQSSLELRSIDIEEDKQKVQCTSYILG